ncbi:Non-specific serine/threonine protein kinase [Bertholletia excelsa]
MDFFLILLSIHFFFCFLHPFATAQNITLVSSLTANGSNSSWVSPSGDFAFGFRSIKTNGYLLAIWFDKIPEKTIVWSAKVDALAEEGSKVQFTTDGKFMLLDPSGKQIWPCNLSKGGAAYATMLDSGNFVVAKTSGAILWQSFDEPTVTIQGVLMSLVGASTPIEKVYTHNKFRNG